MKTNTAYEGYTDIRLNSKDGGYIMENYRITEDNISGMPTIKPSKAVTVSA